MTGCFFLRSPSSFAPRSRRQARVTYPKRRSLRLRRCASTPGPGPPLTWASTPRGATPRHPPMLGLARGRGLLLLFRHKSKGRATAAPGLRAHVLRPGGHAWKSVTPPSHIARAGARPGTVDLWGSNQALKREKTATVILGRSTWWGPDGIREGGLRTRANRAPVGASLAVVERRGRFAGSPGASIVVYHTHRYWWR